MNPADCSRKKEDRPHATIVHHPVSHHLLRSFPEASHGSHNGKMNSAHGSPAVGTSWGLRDAWGPRVGHHFRGQGRTDTPVKPACPLLLSQDCDTVSRPPRARGQSAHGVPAEESSLWCLKSEFWNKSHGVKELSVHISTGLAGSSCSDPVLLAAYREQSAGHT